MQRFYLKDTVRVFSKLNRYISPLLQNQNRPEPPLYVSFIQYRQILCSYGNLSNTLGCTVGAGWGSKELLNLIGETEKRRLLQMPGTSTYASHTMCMRELSGQKRVNLQYDIMRNNYS